MAINFTGFQTVKKDKSSFKKEEFGYNWDSDEEQNGKEKKIFVNPKNKIFKQNVPQKQQANNMKEESFEEVWD